MDKIKIKDVHPVFNLRNGRYQIGDEMNYISSIEDEGGIFTDLLLLLDGRFDVAEIYTQLREKHQQLRQSDVEEVLEQLNANLHLERSHAYDKSDNDNRHLSNLHFFSNFLPMEHSPVEIQCKFQDLKVALVGLGGLGSNILQQLVGLGVEQFFVIEPDVVEVKNLNRQFLYGLTDVGQPKVTAARNNIKRLNAKVQVMAAQDRVTSQEHLNVLLPQNIDMLICAADTPAVLIQEWCNDVALERGIPFFCGGVGVTQGYFFSMLPTKTPSLKSFFQAMKSSEDEEIKIETIAQSSFVNTAVAPTIILIASSIVNEIVKLYLNLESPLFGKKVDVNFIDMSFSAMGLEAISSASIPVTSTIEDEAIDASHAH